MGRANDVPRQRANIEPSASFLKSEYQPYVFAMCPQVFRVLRLRPTRRDTHVAAVEVSDRDSAPVQVATTAVAMVRGTLRVMIF